MSHSFKLENQVAVVTGSSSGVGRAMALEFAAAGAHVLIHAKTNQPGAEEVAASVRRTGRESSVLMADLATEAEQDWFVKEAFDWKGRVDIWVNNAGADVLTGDAQNWSFEQKLEHLWRVDVVSSIRLSRAVGLRMMELGATDGNAVILNVGWDQVEQGMAGDSGEMFAAIKGSIMAFTKSLARSLAPRVRVNCLAPGWIRTAWGETASDYWQERATSESLLRRWGLPEDVAHMARFLASPAASFITGQTVAINGGFRHRE